jgi:hypothetical protein
MIRILISGSRTWTDDAPIRKALYRLRGRTDVVIIQGCCRGVDLLARKAALDFGFWIQDYPADWDTGLKAGPVRNQEMIDRGKPDLAFIFHHNIAASKGTADMLRRVVAAGIRYKLIEG